MTFRDPDHYTLEEFEDLLADKPHDEKWELIGGRLVRGMVGAKWEHHRIAGNLDFAFTSHIRKKALPCFSYRETFYVKERSQDLSVFPDVFVHCGPLQPGQTSVNDPIILVEVVSKGSDYRDRFEKRGFYQRLPSVNHILFVSVNEMECELLTRLDNGRWESLPLSGPNAVVHFTSLDFSITLAEIYRDVIAA